MLSLHEQPIGRLTLVPASTPDGSSRYPGRDERRLARAIVEEYAGRLAPAFVGTVVHDCARSEGGSDDLRGAADVIRERLDDWLYGVVYPL